MVGGGIRQLLHLRIDFPQIPVPAAPDTFPEYSAGLYLGKKVGRHQDVIDFIFFRAIGVGAGPAFIIKAAVAVSY
jgi:hypothetical protein